MEIFEYSEDTITVTVNENTLEDNNLVLVFILNKLKESKILGIKDFVTSYNSLVVFYNPEIINSIVIKDILLKVYKTYSKDMKNISKIIEIPVCYDSEFGLDHNRYHQKGINKDKLVKLHTEKEYLIHMIGFLPGFPFLSGVNEILKMDRLPSPRTLIAKGSVGIAGLQTGFYPTASPGGWNIIGRTPLNLEIKNDNLDIPFGVGDYIKFVPISRNEFDEIEKLEFNNQYDCVSYERGV